MGCRKTSGRGIRTQGVVLSTADEEPDLTVVGITSGCCAFGTVKDDAVLAGVSRTRARFIVPRELAKPLPLLTEASVPKPGADSIFTAVQP